jgi:hypothetical protein
MFDIEEKYLKCLLEILTPESSANNTGHNVEFVLRERSFIYIIKNRALDLILGELHVLMYPSKRKNFEMNW